jgi:ketosteroid isomerase-like protein
MTTGPTTNGDIVRTLIRAVDNANDDDIAALTAAEVDFRFGNAEPTSTRSELLSAARAFRESIAGLRHTILELWEVGDGTVIALMDVHYQRLDGRELNLPCCNVFRVRNGCVDKYLIYMDINPVLAT